MISLAMLLIRLKKGVGLRRYSTSTIAIRGMSGEMDAKFAGLALERTLRDPFRSYVWIPIERAGRHVVHSENCPAPLLGANLAAERWLAWESRNYP
jgi:hypothetical protein